jgi:hypothetical protein
MPEVLSRASILVKNGFSPRRVAEVTRLRGNDKPWDHFGDNDSE